MKSIDLDYLCTTIGNLSGIPVRIFRGKEQIFYYSQTYLPCDPIKICLEEIFSVKEHVGYITTSFFHCYGIVNAKDLKIVIGPTRQVAESERELKELAFLADVPETDVKAFISGMKGIIRMPFESILQMLCTINHVLNGEKLTLADIAIYDTDQKKLENDQNRQQASLRLSVSSVEIPETIQQEHNSYDQEQLILRLVRKGDSAALKKWLASAPAIRSGNVASEQLRQRKNIFIVTVTLVSRAAIQGGMEVNDAFSLSDFYIQQGEVQTSPDKLMNLQYRMLLDYTECVGKLRLGKQPSRLTLDVANYVQHHISEPVSVEKLAEKLFLSRPYLSRRFKAETGKSLTDFILEEKTEEAKRLLRYSDKSLTAIASYLGFSSQSHFARVFKKYAAMTPGEYREHSLLPRNIS